MGAHVGWDSLLYIPMNQIRGRVLHPHGQASQCIPLLSSEEQQNRGYVNDFPGGCLSRGRQVVRW